MEIAATTVLPEAVQLPDVKTEFNYWLSPPGEYFPQVLISANKKLCITKRKQQLLMLASLLEIVNSSYRNHH